MIKRPEDPHQMYFVSRAELVSEEPLVRTIDQVVKSFDLEALYRRYSEGGRSFYDPAMMLKVLFFAYSDGVRSSREIAKRIGAELKRDVVAEGEDSYDEGLLSTAGGTDEAVKPRTEGGPSSDKVTDPDARFMKTSEGSLRPCYNSQIAVDKNQVIVVAEVSNCADDSVQFKSMIEQSQANVSGAPGVVLVDGGYYSGSNVKHSVSAGYELYMPVPQQRRVPDKRFEREAFVLR